MKNTGYLKFLFTVLFISNICFTQNDASLSECRNRIGFNYGIGNVQGFPFNSKSYIHDTQFYKLQLHHIINAKRKWIYSINIEPALYISEHHEMSDLKTNAYKSQKGEPVHYNPKPINELVLNIGFQLQYKLLNDLSIYFLGSVGPTLVNKKTKRLNKGIAFSDIAALGFNWKMYSTLIDLRLSMRHVSNAGLSFPNRGYNSTSIEVGFTLPLNI